MTQRELKRLLYALVGTYFAVLQQQGNIVWSKTKPVNPNSPYVSLKMGKIKRSYRPIRRFSDDVTVNSYPSRTLLEVNMYTKGAAVTDDPNVTAARENTALNDLTEFVNFLGSEFVDSWCLANDVSIDCNQVHDLTELVNDTSWDYRAMIEVKVGYTQHATGYTGTMYDDGRPYHSNGNPKYDKDGWPLDPDGNRLPGPPLEIGPDGKPIYPPAESTPSGGGSQDLADQSTGWFDSVEIEYKKEDSANG